LYFCVSGRERKIFDVLGGGFCVDGKRKFEFVGDGVGIVITDDRSLVRVTDESLFVASLNDERALVDDDVDEF
jgi:hypothetical protein